MQRFIRTNPIASQRLISALYPILFHPRCAHNSGILLEYEQKESTLFIVSYLVNFRSMDLIEYSSAGRFDVFVRQMREIGFRTETQIREIMRPKRHSANQGSVYKFYCPICMLYYSDILKTDCCDQYICLDCVLSFLKGKGALSPDAEVLPFDLPLVSCLYCTKEPFMLSHPKRSDTAKDYGDGSKSPRLRSESKTAPLKIGDSFDTMKEKMILFESISKPADANELSPKTEVKRSHSDMQMAASPPAALFTPVSLRRRNTDDSMQLDDTPASLGVARHVLPPIRRFDFSDHADDEHHLHPVQDPLHRSLPFDGEHIQMLPNIPTPTSTFQQQPPYAQP
eukprot:TRINITY_DN5829_c0_g1_i6.p2 TRINITY_DN5829_c0_g1~~TRINITY_DN5829_c0_g1_i6.p2  ORF type:complete len:339 (-),score=64.66 TRINITY_DN5829_c0_g1_i6:252-1268(-)